MGADAVMLSGETAVGAHPALVVATMARILVAAEQDPSAPYAGGARMRGPDAHEERPDEEVVRAAVALARATRAEAIVVFTRTGASAVRLSKERPEAPIHAFAPEDDVCRRLALAWGVRPHRLAVTGSTDDVAAEVRATLRGRLSPGARAVLVMGGPEDPAGATTLIRLVTA
jgi:pyruvate kinase